MGKKKEGVTSNLLRARQNKNDEFYTLYDDIDEEIRHYQTGDFTGKVIFLNCDDYRKSQFYLYLKHHFKRLKIKEVHALHKKLTNDKRVYHAVITKDKKGNVREIIKDVGGLTDGDFRGEYSLGVLKKADMVVTNPPFSLAREFITLLMNEQKPFLIIASQNTVTYKEVNPYITEGAIRAGITNGTKRFLLPDEYKHNKNAVLNEQDNRYYQTLGNIMWLTTLEPKTKPKELLLTESYKDNPEKYPKYFNLDAIEVSKVVDIPYDYKGLMGVPITYLNKHDPEKFEVLGHSRDDKFIVETERLKEYRHNKYTGKTVGTTSDVYRPLKPNEKAPMLTYKDENGGVYRRVYSRYIIKAK